MAFEELAELLNKGGYKSDEKAVEAVQADADNPDTGNGSLSENGPYVVHGVYKNGDVVVTVEQTTAPDESTGLKMIIEHPPVVVIESPAGRVACNPNDLEAITAELKKAEKASK